MQERAAIAGIQPSEFWQLTYRDLVNWLNGYAKRNTDEWRRTRLGAYMVYAANSTKEDRKSMTEWLPLEGDNKRGKTVKLMSKKQYAKLKTAWQV